MAEFNLADLLANVSADTGREQIEYVPLESLTSDSRNFYSLSGLDDLAANIELLGLQQPIRVRRDPEQDGRYIIVSGHRRRAAIEMLAAENPEKWGEVPVIVEQDAGSPEMQELRLIYANCNTRSMTSAEISQQAARVEQLLYELKEQGVEFPGRMRDHVAQAVGASKTRLANLKVIRENLAKCWVKDYEKNRINESVALELARMPEQWQQRIYDRKKDGVSGVLYLYAGTVKFLMKRFSAIDKLQCESFKGSCQNRGSKMQQAIVEGEYTSYHCEKCCDGCGKLTSCKNACPRLAEKIKQLKADKKEASQQAAAEKAEKERPKIDFIKAVWHRFGEARAAAGLSPEEVYEASPSFSTPNCADVPAKEDGVYKFTRDTELPFASYWPSSYAETLINVADALGCSVDYLLCRTDNPQLNRAGNVSDSDTDAAIGVVSDYDTGWRTGVPEEPGRYVVLARYNPDGPLTPEKYQWNGKSWEDYACDVSELGIDTPYWMPLPED